jgi:hypothetical protein
MDPIFKSTSKNVKKVISAVSKVELAAALCCLKQRGYWVDALEEYHDFSSCDFGYVHSGSFTYNKVKTHWHMFETLCGTEPHLRVIRLRYEHFILKTEFEYPFND